MDVVTPDQATRSALERETRLVEGAIRSVAGGVSRRVIVGGLRFGAALLGILADEARWSGVRLTALWGVDEAACDIRVERARP